MTPAEELRAAAAKLREMAAGTTKPRKPEYGWDFLDRDEVQNQSETYVVCSQAGGSEIVAEHVTWEDAAWIALLGPNKAELLAVWLETEAHCVGVGQGVSEKTADLLDAIAGEPLKLSVTVVADTSVPALAFARAIVGAQS